MGLIQGNGGVLRRVQGSFNGEFSGFSDSGFRGFRRFGLWVANVVVRGALTSGPTRTFAVALWVLKICTPSTPNNEFVSPIYKVSHGKYLISFSGLAAWAGLTSPVAVVWTPILYPTPQGLRVQGLGLRVWGPKP